MRSVPSPNNRALASTGSDRLPEPAIQQREHQSCTEQSAATRLQLSRLHGIPAAGTAARTVRLPEWGAHQRPLRRYRQLGSHSGVGDRQRADAGRGAARVRTEHARRRPVGADEERIPLRRCSGRDLRRFFRASRRIGPGRRQRRTLGLLRQRRLFSGRRLARGLEIGGDAPVRCGESARVRLDRGSERRLRQH